MARQIIEVGPRGGKRVGTYYDKQGRKRYQYQGQEKPGAGREPAATSEAPPMKPDAPERPTFEHKKRMFTEYASAHDHAMKMRNQGHSGLRIHSEGGTHTVMWKERTEPGSARKPPTSKEDATKRGIVPGAKITTDPAEPETSNVYTVQRVDSSGHFYVKDEKGRDYGPWAPDIFPKARIEAPKPTKPQPKPKGAGTPKTRDPRLPAAGTTLTRSFKGKTHEVTVNEDGSVLYDGKQHTSLSAAARSITGTAVNGFAFFKLGAKATGTEGGGGKKDAEKKGDEPSKPVDEAPGLKRAKALHEGFQAERDAWQHRMQNAGDPGSWEEAQDHAQAAGIVANIAGSHENLANTHRYHADEARLRGDANAERYHKEQQASHEDAAKVQREKQMKLYSGAQKYRHAAPSAPAKTESARYIAGLIKDTFGESAHATGDSDSSLEAVGVGQIRDMVEDVYERAGGDSSKRALFDEALAAAHKHLQIGGHNINSDHDINKHHLRQALEAVWARGHKDAQKTPAAKKSGIKPPDDPNDHEGAYKYHRAMQRSAMDAADAEGMKTGRHPGYAGLHKHVEGAHRARLAHLDKTGVDLEDADNGGTRRKESQATGGPATGGPAKSDSREAKAEKETSAAQKAYFALAAHEHTATAGNPESEEEAAHHEKTATAALAAAVEHTKKGRLHQTLANETKGTGDSLRHQRLADVHFRESDTASDHAKTLMRGVSAYRKKD